MDPFLGISTIVAFWIVALGVRIAIDDPQRHPPDIGLAGMTWVVERGPVDTTALPPVLLCAAALTVAVPAVLPLTATFALGCGLMLGVRTRSVRIEADASGIRVLRPWAGRTQQLAWQEIRRIRADHARLVLEGPEGSVVVDVAPEGVRDLQRAVRALEASRRTAVLPVPVPPAPDALRALSADARHRRADGSSGLG